MNRSKYAEKHVSTKGRFWFYVDSKTEKQSDSFVHDESINTSFAESDQSPFHHFEFCPKL